MVVDNLEAIRRGSWEHPPHDVKRPLRGLFGLVERAGSDANPIDD